MANQTAAFFQQLFALRPASALNKGYIVIERRSFPNRIAPRELFPRRPKAMNLPLCQRKPLCCPSTTRPAATGFRRTLCVGFAVSLVWLALVWTAEAASSEPGKLWLVSSRGLGCSTGAESLDIRLERHGCFVRQNLHQFLKQQRPEVPLVIWVHGNRVSASQAPVIGRQVQRALARHAQEPFQMVVWSWPSAKQGGPLRDARLKAHRADRHGRHLARLLKALGNRPRVGLVGYSYGGRLILAALNELGADPQAPAARYRVVLWVPGVEHSALASCGRFVAAWEHIQQVLLVTNCSDRALRWYPWVEGPHGPEAMGRVGATGLGPEQAQRLQWIEAADQLGPQHDWARLISTPSVVVPSAELLLEAATPRRSRSPRKPT